MVDEAFRSVEEKHPGLGGQVRYYNAIVMLINECVTDVLTHSARRISELGLESVEDVRACPEAVVSFSPEGDARQEELHRFLHANFYNHYRVARMQEKAKRFLGELFAAYVTNPRILPGEVQEAADREGIHRAACDWIASMTDRQAQGEYVKVFQPFERM